MNYALIVLSSTSDTALEFAQALQKRGHQLKRVFFYKDGVLAAHIKSEQAKKWQALNQHINTELICCVASANRRSIYDQQTAKKTQDVTLHPAFSIGGLGLYADTLINCDKVIHFG